MRFAVRWGDGLTENIARRFGHERTGSGNPSERDFVNGPLAAATQRFIDFESLPAEAGPAVRSVHVFHPAFGPVVFVGVLVEPTVVEIAGFDDDPDYWRLIDDDPDE